MKLMTLNQCSLSFKNNEIIIRINDIELMLNELKKLKLINTN